MIEHRPGRVVSSLLLLVAGALLFAVGCDGAADCSADSDCFAGEECVEGRCAVAEGADTGRDVAEDAADDIVDDTADDTSSSDTTQEDAAMDTGGEEDAVEDTTSDTGGQDALDASTGGPACVVDKFVASCPDQLGEPNEGPVSGYPLNDNSTIGCPNRDEFKPLSETHSSWLCANEESDWYKAIVYPCDSFTFIIEARFTPKTECNRDFYRAMVGNMDCSDQNLSCAWEGESYVMRRLIETGSSGMSYYFGIEKVTEGFGEDEELQLEYDVTFETRR